MPLLPKMHLSSTTLSHTAEGALASWQRLQRTPAGVLRRPLAFRPTPRLAGLAVITIILAVLVIGSTQVTTQMMSRPRQIIAAREAARGWGHDVVGSLAPAKRLAWEKLLQDDPALVLDICSIPLSPSR